MTYRVSLWRRNRCLATLDTPYVSEGIRNALYWAMRGDTHITIEIL